MSVFKPAWFDHPLSERVRMRRSTALLAVGFVGLALLYVHTHPDPDADPHERVVVVATASTSTDPTTTEDP